MELSFSGESQTEINELLELALQQGEKIITYAKKVTAQQLAHFVDHIYKQKTSRKTATIDRSLTKGLCCFLKELQEAGRPVHYSVIRQMVKEKYNHNVNDYATLKYFELMEHVPKMNGYWQITNMGRGFLKGTVEVPEKLTIENKKVVKRSKAYVSIRDFKRFDIYGYDVHVPDYRNEPEGPIK